MKNNLLWVISGCCQNLSIIFKESPWHCIIFMLKHVKHKYLLEEYLFFWLNDLSALHKEIISL